MGYRVMAVAAGGEAALARVDSCRPDLVLRDVMLSGALNGIESAQELWRGDEPMPVFLTARNDRTTSEPIRGSMLFAGLIKPPGEKKLSTVLGMALRGQDVEHQVQRFQLHLALVVDVVADAVIALDSADGVSFLNATAERLCGLDRSVAEGRFVDDVLTALVTFDDHAERAWKRLLTLRIGETGTRVMRCFNAAVSSGEIAKAVTVIMLSHQSVF